jgi:DNA-binding beta-propeller fold protein YncE
MNKKVSLRRKIFTVIFVFISFLFHAKTAHCVPQQLYWTEADSGCIKRSNLDGTGVTELITNLDFPFGICIDAVHGEIYWAGGSNGNGVIQRANLNGSQVETLVSSGLGCPSAIVLDQVHNKILWSDFNKQRLQRANLDGTGVENILTGLGFPKALTIDMTNQKLYWSDRVSYKGVIRRSNLDGSNIENLITTGLDDPSGIALDLDAGKLYLTDADTGSVSIKRTNIDGKNIETIVTGLWCTRGIVLDPAAHNMYWADARPGGEFGAVRCATLDGGNVTTLIDDAYLPLGVTIGPIPEPATLLLFSLGGLILRKRKA